MTVKALKKKNNMAFKMKGVPYPTNRKGKINPNSECNTDLKDGRSKSSTFQFAGVAEKSVFGGGGSTAAAQAMQQANPLPNVPPIMSKPSMAKIYDKPKGKRTKY